MKLYTMGYGLLKGSHAERKKAFQDRLIGIQKRLDKKLCIVDVRKARCGSRNGHAFDGEDVTISDGANVWEMSDTVLSLGNIWGMRDTVFSLGIDFYYIHKSALSNPFGSTQAGLKRYKDCLQAKCDDRADCNAHVWYLALVRDIRKYMDSEAHILLCGCRDAYKKTGAVNCHRVILAEQLVKELGEGWEVEHL